MRIAKDEVESVGLAEIPEATKPADDVPEVEVTEFTRSRR
jgi:hypothetical protein